MKVVFCVLHPSCTRQFAWMCVIVFTWQFDFEKKPQIIFVFIFMIIIILITACILFLRLLCFITESWNVILYKQHCITYYKMSLHTACSHFSHLLYFWEILRFLRLTVFYYFEKWKILTIVIISFSFFFLMI